MSDGTRQVNFHIFARSSVLIAMWMVLTGSLYAAPKITSLSPTSGNVGTSVTISGSAFGSTQGTSTIKFNGVTATVTSWTASKIVAPVPTAATTGNVVVTVNGSSSNGVAFTVTPKITALSPSSGAIGASVTINGSGFGSAQGTNTVKFNGTTATPSSWSATSIITPVPTGATTGNVVVSVNSVVSSGFSFTVLPAPSMSGLSPNSGAVGASVTINGSNFGSTQGSSTVSFNGTLATPTSWNANSIVAPVPSGATTGSVVVHASGVNSNGVSFTVLPAPTISGLSPTSGAVGAPVTINGNNFGATQGTGTVSFNGALASATSWSATSITTTVPSGASTGNVVVNASGVSSNGVSFTVLPTPNISGVSPTSGPIATSVTITGTNFGATQGLSTLTFNGTTATPTAWADTSIIVPVPSGATSGNVVVTANGAPSNGASFTITPFISGLSPTSGAVGASVTISGTSFGLSEGSSTVKFNGASATPTNWADNSIVAPVPSGATTGNVVITVNGNSSNGVNFTVTTLAATLQSIAVAPGTASIGIGIAQSFTATGTYSDGSKQDLTIDSTWTTSDPTVASVDVTGVATGINSGQVTLQANVGTIVGSATLTVTPGQLDAVVTPVYTPSGFFQSSLNQKAISVAADGFSRFVTAANASGGDAIVFVRCLDEDCSTSHTATFNTPSFPAYSSALGPDGFARIAYSTGGGVNLIQCSDDDCATSTTTFIDYPSDNGVVSVAVGSDGTSYVVYDDGNDVSGPQGVGMATCNGGSCSLTHVADVSIYDSISGVITIGADGNPVIIYEDSGNTNLGVPDSVHYYQNGTDTVISSNGIAGVSDMDAAIAPDGFARVAILNDSGSGADFIKCMDAACTSYSTNPISFSGPDKDGVSLAVDANGNAFVQGESHTAINTFRYWLDYFQCTKPDCSTYADQQITGSWTSLGSPYLGVALDLNGLPRMIAQQGTVNGPPPTTAHLRPSPLDHLVVQNDTTKVVCTSSSNTVRRRISYSEVDANENTIAGDVSVKEQFATMGVNTCNTNIRTTQTCTTTTGGFLGDQLFVGCNSVGGSCGFTYTNQQWLWCPASGSTPVVIAAPGDLVVHNDSVTVSGCTKFPMGTKIKASGITFPAGKTCGSD